MSMLEEMQNRSRLVLDAWNLPGQEPQLLKYRENAVFRVRLGNGAAAALRLHRPGYHSEPALRSELQFMSALKEGGLAVPEPIATRAGDFLVQTVDGQFADLIGWVHGSEIGESGTPLARSRDEIVAIYHGVGVAMAGMHDIADGWTAPEGFVRSAWNAAGLLGDAPLWGQFWDCPGLAPEDRDFLARLRARLQVRLADIDGDLDYGLIHADLVRENVLVQDGTVAMIDFDDCGYGWRLFDIATALLRNRREPHYAALRQALIDGYRTRRRLEDADLAHLPLFLLLRSLTYIGWAGARPELPDCAERLARYVRDARGLAGDVL
jgi:Ser/Thr protein kinase RdoA (MazF antagonist)